MHKRGICSQAVSVRPSVMFVYFVKIIAHMSSNFYLTVVRRLATQ